jgi:hypothetical protein
MILRVEYDSMVYDSAMTDTIIIAKCSDSTIPTRSQLDSKIAMQT